MTETVHVRHLIADTVCEETWAADRIIIQTWRGGRALLTLHRGGRVTEQVGYAHADRIHRVREEQT